MTNTSTHAGGVTDAFIVKYNGSGTVQWATYFGGDGEDEGWSIATDGGENIVFTGFTRSTNLPVTNSSTISGLFDAFVFKYSGSGTIQWGMYLGGSAEEYGYGIATDGNGNVVLTGTTASGDFPVTNSSVNAGYRDIFIAKLNAGGVLQWATYYGGSGFWGDQGRGIATDGSGNVVISGETNSTDFPVTNSSAFAGGVRDAFVVKFSGGGTCIWSTYYGGNGDDYGGGIAIDGSGSIFLSGETYSTNLPVTNSSNYAGSGDAFVTKYGWNGVIQWATYYGGSGNDAWGNSFGKSIACATDGSGNIIITGTTNSTNILVTNSSTMAGIRDAFVVSYSPNGFFPIELLSFSASLSDTGILLSWDTATEIDNHGFEIERAMQFEGPWETRGFLLGYGTSSSSHEYAFRDASFPLFRSGKMFYRLKQIDFDGTFHYSHVVAVLPSSEPNALLFSPPYPQPASHSAAIRFTLPEDDVMTIALFEPLGSRIIQLLKETFFPAGTQSVTVQWKKIPPGVYLICLEGAHTRTTQRIVIQ